MNWRSVALLLALVTPIFSQSIDEEESVNVGGAGSGNGDPDDEDLQGSGLPPERSYATTPLMVHPKFTSRLPEETTHSAVKSVSTVVTQRHQTVSYPSSSTPRIITRPVESSEVGGWEINWLLVLAVCLFVVVVALVVIYCICKSCNNKKQAYRPGRREQSASGLLSKRDY